MANIYGNKEFKVAYYDGTWKEISPSFEVYASKYEMNIEDNIELKTIEGERVKFYKGMHHKFTITYYVVDSALYNEFMLAQSKDVRFFMHTDFDKYYTVNITSVKPIYLKQNVFCDGLTIVFETNDYQELVNKKPAHTIIEAWKLGDNLVGLNGSYYTLVGSQTTPSGGKFNKCMSLASGGNYAMISNSNYANYGTMNVWFKLPNSSNTGSFINIDDNATTDLLDISKNATNGDGTVDITITLDTVTSTVVEVNEGEWILLTVLFGQGRSYVYLNNVLACNKTFNVDPKRITLGSGVNARNFDIFFDEFILSNRPSDNITTDNQEYWYNNGLGKQFSTVKYYI